MKKIHFWAVLTASMMAFSSCGLVESLTAIAQEAEEIAEGKCFTVKEGTVVYENGTIVTFTDYGKNWASFAPEYEGDSTALGIIVKDGQWHVLDYASRTYYVNNSSDIYGGCPYIFWEKAYELGKKWGNIEGEFSVKKSSETIAGKKCTVFANGDEKIGGWQRILFLDTDLDGTVQLRAKEWSTSVNQKLFSIEGFKKTEEYDF